MHNEELHFLYPSPNITAINSVGMRWEEHAAHVGMMSIEYFNSKTGRKETTQKT
jgi:hypothetical protein